MFKPISPKEELRRTYVMRNKPQSLQKAKCQGRRPSFKHFRDKKLEDKKAEAVRSTASNFEVEDEFTSKGSRRISCTFTNKPTGKGPFVLNLF